MRLSVVQQAALGLVSMTVLAAGSSSDAWAQAFVYGAGSTLPSVTFRELLNCYGNDVDGSSKAYDPTQPGPGPRAATCIGPDQGGNRTFAYAPVGSGRSLEALMLRSPAALGQVPASNPIPYADNVGPDALGSVPLPSGLTYGVAPASAGFVRHHFSVSEAPLFLDDPYSAEPTRTELGCFYGTNGDPACGATDRRLQTGAIKQVPAMIASVHIAYNLPGLAGQLRLSRTQLCGIFTGAITDWNDPAIRSGNGGVNGAITGMPGRSEPIRVVTQSDGSGATFLLTDHLNAICPGWTAAVSGQTGSGGEVGMGGTGSKIAAFWSKPHFFAVAGDNGSAVAIAANPWTIGYVSPEVVKPYVTAVSQPASETYTDATGLNTLAVTGGAVYGASPTARLQNRSGNYRNPTLFNAATSLLDTRPPQGAAALNPENWAAAGRVPDPTQPEGYPIAGFTWWSSHTCYFRGDVVSAIRGYWDWHTRYGAPPVPANAQVQRILYSNGFDILQFMPRLAQTDNWNGATRVHMILDPATQIARAGSGSPSCAGVSPGAM